MALIASARPSCTRTNENKFYLNDNGSVYGNSIIIELEMYQIA